MRIAVVFTSKFGATRRAAEYIAKALDAEIFDIKQQLPSVDVFDMIVFGSGIYMGRMPRSMRSFLTNNAERLSEKRTALFVCCTMHGEKAEKQLALAAESVGDTVTTAYLCGKHKGKIGIDVKAADQFIESVREIN